MTYDLQLGLAEDLEVVLCPGKYKSDDNDPLHQQKAVSEYNCKFNRDELRIFPDFTASVFLANHPFLFPSPAQTLNLLSVSHQFRNEVPYLLFRRNLIFPRIYDFQTRIPIFLPRLPTDLRDYIEELSIDISMNSNMSTHFGNFVIPYLPLCPRLEIVELRFSMRFHREIAWGSRSSGQVYRLFGKLMKFLVCLLTCLRIDGQEITIGKS